MPVPLFLLRRSLMAARIIFLSSKSFDSSSCGRKKKHCAVTFPNIPSQSCWDLVLINKLCAFKPKSSRIMTWAWSTILSRSSSSSMAASCSAVSFPERSLGLAWVLDPLGMAGTWHATWTDGAAENIGSEATTGSVSICTRCITQTHTAWARAHTHRHAKGCMVTLSSLILQSLKVLSIFILKRKLWP